MCEIKDITDKEGFKIIRKRKKIMLREVAEYVDLAICTISRFENDIKEIPLEKEKRYIEFINNYTKEGKV